MKRHAIVVGGGIGGLLAVHGLTGRFDRVTLIERDCYPSSSEIGAPAARRGAPQSRCPHMLMAAGAAAFDDLLPGWRDEFVALGGVAFDASADAALRFPAGWLPRAPSGIIGYTSSRALLETLLRRRLMARPDVATREGARVTGLLGDARGVTGVTVADAERTSAVEADLVVDASGRTSALPAWIHALPGCGDGPVPETVVESATRYVSRWFHVASAAAPDWRCLSIAPTPASGHRGLMIVRAEHNRWGVVLVATGDDVPSDDAAFVSFAGGLGERRLAEFLRRAEAVSPIHHYAAGSSRMRHYERLPVWPAGLVAIGDAVCALDPYFGLGMTAAASGAALLGSSFERGADSVGAALSFQRRLASVIFPAWRLATGGDTRDRAAAGDRAHVNQLYATAPSNPAAAHAAIGVQHLLHPEDALRRGRLE